MVEKSGRKERRWRWGFCLTRVWCGPQLPIMMMGSAARAMSTTRYWLSDGSVPIWMRSGMNET